MHSVTLVHNATQAYHTIKVYIQVCVVFIYTVKCVLFPTIGVGIRAGDSVRDKQREHVRANKMGVLCSWHKL